MACDCDPCDEPLRYNCAYCCGTAFGCNAINPLTGKCVDADDCLDECDNGLGQPATVIITFPQADDLSGSGYGSWVMPPGGPVYWANVDFGNDPPDFTGTAMEDAVLVEVAVASGGTPDDVRTAFSGEMAALWDTLNISSDRLRLTSAAVGYRGAADESGPFGLSGEFGGLDAGENPCQLVELEGLPYDGHRPYVDLDGDDIDDYSECLSPCDATWADELAACEIYDAGSYDRCECDSAANIAHQTCVEQCRVDFTPIWLDAIQTKEIDARNGCCRGAYAGCVSPCEQTWFNAVKAHELTVAQDEMDGVVAIIGYGCAELEEDNPFGPQEATDFQRDEVRRCLGPAREVVHATPRLNRAKCVADCRRAEMYRRKRCDAQEEHCTAYRNAEYEAEAAACASAFMQCKCDTPEEDCGIDGGEAALCASTALITATQERSDCCLDRHPFALHEHALAECLREAWDDLASEFLGCCYGYDGCVLGCTGGDIADQGMCYASCLAEQETCGDASQDAYNDARELCYIEHRGDCPVCFEPGLLAPIDAPECSVSIGYDQGCGPVDPETGFCPGTTNPCSDPEQCCDSDCELDCCPFVDTNCRQGETTINCGGVICTKLYSEEGCNELLEDDCPDTFSASPIGSGCAITWPD